MPYLSEEELQQAQAQAQQAQTSQPQTYKPQGTVARGQMAPPSSSGIGSLTPPQAQAPNISVEEPQAAMPHRPASGKGGGGSPVMNKLLGIKSDPLGDKVKELQIQNAQETMKRNRDMAPLEKASAEQKLQSNQIAISTALIQQSTASKQDKQEALKEFVQRSTMGGLIAAQIEAAPPQKRAEIYASKQAIFKHIDENAPDEYNPDYTQGMVSVAATTSKSLQDNPKMQALAFPDKDRQQMAQIFNDLQAEDELKLESVIGKVVQDRIKLKDAGYAEDSKEIQLLDNKLKREVPSSESLRKSFVRQAEDFIKVDKAYQKVKAVTKEPSAAGDIALIFNFMKMLDPNSVVRESEYATAENAGSVPQRVWAQYNKALDGKRLSPEQRTDFMSQTDNLYGAASKNHAKLESEYTRIAKETGVSPTEVIVDYRTKEGNLVDSARPSKEEILTKAKELSKQSGKPVEEMEIMIRKKLDARKGGV